MMLVHQTIIDLLLIVRPSLTRQTPATTPTDLATYNNQLSVSHLPMLLQLSAIPVVALDTMQINVQQETKILTDHHQIGLTTTTKIARLDHHIELIM
jgi:hypothetical protein